MALEYRNVAGGKRTIIMTECPACGYAFTAGGQDRIAHFRNDHSPEDFGLTPLAD